MECTIEVDIDSHPSLYAEKLVKARKECTCCECRDKIPIGSEYEYVSGLWNGHFDSFRTCIVCKEIRDKIFCSWTFEEIWATLYEEFLNSGLGICQVQGLSQKAIEKLSDYISQWLKFEEES